jgi:hypothetical protein
MKCQIDRIVNIIAIFSMGAFAFLFDLLTMLYILHLNFGFASLLLVYMFAAVVVVFFE